MINIKNVYETKDGYTFTCINEAALHIAISDYCKKIYGNEYRRMSSEQLEVIYDCIKNIDCMQKSIQKGVDAQDSLFHKNR